MLLRVREVMSELACSRSHVYDLIGRGELQFIRDGRMVRVTRDSLQRYVRRRLQGG